MTGVVREIDIVGNDSAWTAAQGARSCPRRSGPGEADGVVGAVQMVALMMRAAAVGGARIDVPRTKICTMSMAAPQCAQTKHGLSDDGIAGGAFT